MKPLTGFGTFFSLLTISSAASASLTVELYDEFPTRDTVTVVTVRDAAEMPVRGAVVSVKYYPGSKIERVDTVGVTDPSGYLLWRPKYAGVVSVSARKDSESVSINRSVKFDSIPGSGILVLMIAGIVLMGGAGWSILRLYEKDVP